MLEAVVATPEAQAAEPAEPAERPLDTIRELTTSLRILGERLQALRDQAALRTPDGGLRKQLQRIRRELRALDRDILANFAELEAPGGAVARSPGALQRNADVRKAYRTGMRGLLRDLTDAARRGDGAGTALERAIEQLLASGEVRQHQPLDPEQLPVRPASRLERAPRTQDPLVPAAVAAAAALPPQPADLLPNEDAQITPQIEALADSLANQPLQIFDWVRNNVDFTPTYGSVQGSQMTLDARRGNAFDIASLLIALLRAAGVSARYVVGTVELPVAEVLDLVGGVPTSGVAQQLLGQGGVANIAITQGGVVRWIRFEHAWVEAYIDFVPSRGTVHRVGDTWIPMDASIKRHAFVTPTNLLADRPFDMATLSNQMLAGATVDPALGKITNLNQEVAGPFLESYAEQVGDYLSSQGIDPTLGGALGRQSIVPLTSQAFAGTLPYDVVASSTPDASLPAATRHYVTLKGSDPVFGGLDFVYRVSLPALNSRRLAVRYQPATPADASILEDARSSGASSLPLHLVNVVPVVQLDDTTVATGPALGMGERQAIDVVLSDPDGATTLAYEVNAGDELVFGVTGNGMPQSVVQARLAAVPAVTAAESLHQIALHYWMESDFFALLTGRGLGVHVQRLTSAGLFSSPLTVSYLFGFPRSGVYESRFMDVKQTLFAAAGTDPAKVVTFHKQSGVAGSFMEALAFDQFSGGISGGISAIQLISEASAAGVPVYFIEPSNVASVLPLLSLDASVESDIASSVAAGKTVLVPEHNVVHGPWSGVGYIVTDEATGAAAYLISGGLNGGGFFECHPELVPILVAIVVFIVLAVLLWIYWPAIVAAAAPALARLSYMMASLAALFATTTPAYAGGLKKGGQANPCCPPPPPPGPCVHDTGHKHGPCLDVVLGHWHFTAWNQSADCVNHEDNHVFGGCGPPPVPVGVIPCPPC